MWLYYSQNNSLNSLLNYLSIFWNHVQYNKSGYDYDVVSV